MNESVFFPDQTECQWDDCLGYVEVFCLHPLFRIFIPMFVIRFWRNVHMICVCFVVIISTWEMHCSVLKPNGEYNSVMDCCVMLLKSITSTFRRKCLSWFNQESLHENICLRNKGEIILEIIHEKVI